MSRSSSPASSSGSTSTKSTCSSCPLWPESYSVISHIALNAGLEEICNFPDDLGFGLGLAAHLESRNDKAWRRGITSRMTGVASLFSYYRTGTHGPQFGYKLILVEKGNDVDLVEKRIMASGPIGSTTAEMLVFPRDGQEMIVLPDNISSPTSPETDQIASGSILRSSYPETATADVPGAIATKIRQASCCRPISRLTLGGTLLRVTSDDRQHPDHLLLVVESRNSPERVEQQVLGWLEKQRDGEKETRSDVCLVFREKDGEMSVYPHTGRGM